MLERDLNGIIRKSFEVQGDFAFKIPDAGQIEHGKLPFDLFSFYHGYFIAVESKWLSKPGSLDLHRLQDHQLEALYKTRTLKYSHALFAVGINYGIRDKRVYVFDDLDYIKYRRDNKLNILKKEWDVFENFVTIKHELIDVEQLFSALQKQPHLD